MLLSFFRKNRGSITIFLCLMLLPMITYSSMIIDASRLQSCRTQLQSAGDLTMNAAMSEYEQILQDMYGLFAISADADELKPALKNYFYETISGTLNSNTDDEEYVQQLATQLTDVVFKEGMTQEDVTNYMYMKLQDFTYEPIPESRISNPMVMKSQIIDYMKYKGPVSLANNLMTKIGVLKDTEAQSQAAHDKIKYTQEINKLNDPMKEAYEAIVEYNKLVEKYNNSKYDNYTDLHTLVDDMCSKIWDNAYNAALRNNFEAFYKDRLRTDSVGDTYNKINIDARYGYFDTNSIDTSGVRDSDGAKSKLDDMISCFKNVFYDYDNPSHKADLVDLYGDITVRYNPSDSTQTTSASFGDKPYENGFRPTYGNIVNWKGQLDQRAGYHYENYGGYTWLEKNSDGEMLLGYYEYLTELLDHLSDISEFKAYKEYFRDLTRSYWDTYDAYEEELKELEDFDKYVRAYNTMAVMYNTWICGYNGGWDTNTKYNELCTYLQGIGEFRESSSTEATKEFRDYYVLVGQMEEAAQNVITKLDAVLGVFPDIESARRNWKTSIEGVSDSTTRSQMQNDLATLTAGVKAEDVDALKDVVTKIKSQLTGLKGNIESVYFLGDQLCTSEFKFDDILHKEILKPLSFTTKNAQDIINVLYEDVYDSDKNWDLGTYITGYIYGSPELQLDTLTENAGYVELLDGKDRDNNENEAETFYNTLYNGYGHDSEPEGISTTPENADQNSDSQIIAEINENSDADIEESSDDSDDSDGDNDLTKASRVGEAYADIEAHNVAAEDSGQTFNTASGSSIPTSKDGDFNKSADTGVDNLEAAQGILKAIGEIVSSVAEDVYLEEYFTEMFTCQTDKKLDPGKLQLINGYSNIDGSSGRFKPLNTSTGWYGKEIEYILWGDSDLNKNLRTTEGYIFLIRFALNAIYAFTASDIQTFANSVAAAICGLVPVLIPVVQVVITLGIALAESSYDLIQLKNGEDVPVIKNKKTFVCSPTGALQKVGTDLIEAGVKSVENMVENKIEEQIDGLTDLAGKKISDCEAQVNKIVESYTATLTDTVKSAIHDQVFTPILNTVSPITGNLNQTASNASSLVEEQINKAWTAIGEGINSMDSSVAKDLTTDFYESRGESFKEELKRAITDKIRDTSDAISPNTILNALKEKLNDELDDFQVAINDKVSSVTSKMKDEIMSHANETATNLKSYVHEQVGEISSQITGKLTDGLGNAISEHASDLIPDVDKSATGGLTLNYKEYCKIFMFMKLTNDNGETSALLRSAALIEVNCQTAAENANEDFKMSDAHTLVYIGAEVEMPTLFPWAVSIDADDSGTPGSASLDFAGMGRNSVTIRYSGLNGY